MADLVRMLMAVVLNLTKASNTKVRSSPYGVEVSCMSCLDWDRVRVGERGLGSVKPTHQSTLRPARKQHLNRISVDGFIYTGLLDPQKQQPTLGPLDLLL